MSAKAGIVVTGHEVLSSRVTDRNGPWLAQQLDRLGVDLIQRVVVGDRGAEIYAALNFLKSTGVDLIVTSGGLGPTADDLTVAAVARFAGRELLYSRDLRERIERILEPYVSRWHLDSEAVQAANRKQATVPRGALVLGPVGTAPGLVVNVDGVTVVVLPGPPGQLRGTWEEAISTEPV